MNGRHLAQCGREAQEKSSVLWKGAHMNSRKPSISSRKEWEKFVQWVRYKIIMIVMEFKQDCEWKWLVSKHSENFHIKENRNGRKKIKKKRENNRQSEY